jgi:hypothetical protein
MAGLLINCRGTTVMVDPLLGGFDMPVMIEFPIATAEVPELGDVLSRTATTTTTALVAAERLVDNPALNPLDAGSLR